MTIGEGLSDAELLARCAEEPELFAELYRRHVRTVLVYFVARTGCAQTAADLCAETFAAAFAGRRRFRDEGAPVVAWLFGIARRQLGTYRRRQRVERRYRDRMGIGEITLSDDDIERVEALVDLAAVREQLSTGVRQLPSSRAEAMQLRFVDGLSFAEVADRLGITEGAARVRVCRGLGDLAKHMERS